MNETNQSNAHSSSPVRAGHASSRLRDPSGLSLETVLTETRAILRDLDGSGRGQQALATGPLAVRLEALRARLAELAGAASHSEPHVQAPSRGLPQFTELKDALEDESHGEEGRRLRLAEDDARQRRALGSVSRFDGMALGETSGASSGTSPVRLPPGEAAQMEDLIGQVGVMLRAPGQEDFGGSQPTGSKLAAAQTTFAGVLTRTPGLAQMDVTQLAQWAMQEAYARNNTDLREYAVRTNFFTELRAQIRDETNRARRFRSSMQSPSDRDGLSEPFSMLNFDTNPQIDAGGNWSVRTGSPIGTTDRVKALDTYIKDMEALQSTIGDDQQLAQLQLQGMMQRQTQMMSALSSVSKALHETAMSILRKIGN